MGFTRQLAALPDAVVEHLSHGVDSSSSAMQQMVFEMLLSYPYKSQEPYVWTLLDFACLSITKKEEFCSLKPKGNTALVSLADLRTRFRVGSTSKDRVVHLCTACCWYIRVDFLFGMS
jgi:hypothetical protein